MEISRDDWKKLNAVVERLDFEYQQGWKSFYRELSEFLLPMRYSWLDESAVTAMGAMTVSAQSGPKGSTRNKRILDATGTKAARDLAAGMLNGVTSPARPWFNLRISGFPTGAVLPVELGAWLEEIRRRMLLILAESNFYNSMGMLLLDMVVFGTSAMVIYEDYEDVIRCYVFPVGEFRLAQDNRRNISTLARVQLYTLEQLVSEFGLESLCRQSRERFRKGGANIYHTVKVAHLIEPNRQDERYLRGGFAFREFYWEMQNNPECYLLRRAGFTEKPFGCPRWETMGNETYGLSPGMEALPDVIQLQHETLRKAEALDKMTDPPVIMDAILRNQKGAANPGARFYAPGHSQVGGRPLYDVRMPIGELSADIVDVQTRIREAFFNDLFRMISQLETVRSATEIDARREEKLVLMGAVLERLENEALDPFISRCFGIMKRKGLLPPVPQGFGDLTVEIQYVSILSDAQRAVGTGVIERFMQVIGNVAGLVPDIANLPDWEELLREYATRLSVPAGGLKSEEELAQQKQQNADLQNAQQAALVGEQLTGAAKNLGAVDVGGGRNAFQELTGL